MHIISTGMVSPVGLSAESACAAMRAGISAFEELPYCDNNGEPIMGAVVPGFALEYSNFEERLINMLACAVSECLGKVPQLSSERLPVLVALAELGRPGFPSGLAKNIIDRLEVSLGRNFHPELSGVIPNGHTSGFEALNIARKILSNDEVPACLVCGVDSYVRAGTLLWLDQHFRLKTEENSDGVIPGEVAAAVLVCTNQNASFVTSTRLTGLGFGRESASVLTKEPFFGLGLAEATRVALSDADIQMHELDFRLSDVTGEGYGFKEQALTLSRVMRVRKEEFPIWHYSDTIGDIGSVAGICQIMIAFYAFQKGYAPGNRVVCSTSSVSELRSVAVLEYNT